VLNEIAPRPHNSGHYTIEACYTSQFEQHLRCVLGLPMGDTRLKVPAAVMVNILGTGDLRTTLAPCQASLSLSGSTIHLYGKSECKKGRKMGHITLVGDNIQDLLRQAESLTESQLTKTTPLRPVIGIIMGSDSDLPTLKPAAELLRSFEVPFELTIVSAHRTPERMVQHAKEAHQRGLQVIIAAAGGAAHLPGMVAALTPLPVIGVPVALKYLDGMDSLYSIVQMPRGVPVATVAINNSVNAALLALRILGSHNPKIQKQLTEWTLGQKDVVMNKVDKIKQVGWEDYTL
jgi:phosphoribosylaminoimidazole carboxylase